MKYRKVYPWNVIDEVRGGKVVFVLDKKLKKIAAINTVQLQDVIRVTESEEENRYDFWYEEKEPETEETDEEETEDEVNE
jgi:hypothetical protein